MWGEKGKQLRKQLKIGQTEIADKAGFSQSSISAFEQATYPDLKYIATLCDMAGLQLWEFFMSEEQKANMLNVSPSILRVCDALRALDGDDLDEILDLIIAQVQLFSKKRQARI